MRVDKDCLASFRVFIVLSIAMLAIGSLFWDSWKIDPVSGRFGTSGGYPYTLASYELDAGDTIYYEYDASETCWFIIYTIITTDSLDPVVDEKLNLSGTRNTGSFECQTDAGYFLRVVFLETPPEGMATIDFEAYALNEFSVPAWAAMTIVMAVLTVLFTYPAYRACRSGDRRFLHTGLCAAGGAMIVAASVIEYLNPTTDLAELALELLVMIGGSAIALGVLLGILTRSKDKEGEAIGLLAKWILVITVIAIVAFALTLLFIII